MGLHLEYQALPHDISLIERAKRDIDFGEHLAFFRDAIIKENFAVGWQNQNAAQDFQRYALQIAKQHPGIEHRYFFGGRDWQDILHYLLSEQRRSSNTSWASVHENDLIWRAIWGGDVISEAVRASQGVPITYILPDETANIAEILSQENEKRLSSRFDVRCMAKAKVLNVGEDYDPTEQIPHILKIFMGLKGFYTAAAKNNEGVITIFD